jgi:retron-type reverse transcriptase
MSHEWTVKFVEHRAGDPSVIRLIQKWLKAGVSEEWEWTESKAGTPQGAVISPLLANIYLHYAFDLWVEAWRRKVALQLIPTILLRGARSWRSTGKRFRLPAHQIELQVGYPLSKVE